MSLNHYKEKRNFSETKEPIAAKKAASKKLRFVVQRHHASHLHYDLRLEVEGVLKSWAVPKGPSLYPKDKRLAMMVEDHPFEYKSFEGEIPKGNYGAGTVYIFDEGEYQSLSKTRKNDEAELLKGLKEGSLKFRLNGKILKGEFALVRLKNAEQNAWLLIKHNDDYSIDKKYDIEDFVPATIKKAGKDFKKIADKIKPSKSIPEVKVTEKQMVYSPMLATLSNHIFNDKDWVFEKKLDGYRIIAKTGKTTLLTTRNGKDYSSNFSIISEDLKKIKEEAVIDGEIVALDKNGKDDFQTLQHYENNQKVILKYFVFDLLSLDNHDLTKLPLIKRKELLKKLIGKYAFDEIIFHPHVEERGEELLAEARKLGWEGIIAKKKDGEYYVGKRSDSWLKFKFNNSQEAVICGFTKPAGSRKYFGALVLGIWDDDKLTYIGNCGTGFKDQDLKEIKGEMDKYIVKSKPFDQKVNQEKLVTWLKPKLVCEVNFAEWTQDHHLRHPVFKGLRKDKNQDDAVEVKLTESISLETKIIQGEVIKVGNKKVKLTHLDKIYWPEEKITKGDLITYYRKMAKFILPYLKNKPLSLNRHPNGINQPSFFQKDVNTEQIPTWAKTAKMHSDSTDKEIDYLLCNDEASLIFMANLGCIEVNPWLSSFKKPNSPDFMVIDLDPDSNTFSEVVKVALEVKAIYDEMGIKSFVKTSGSTGIHIYVYVGAVYDYDFVKNFAQFIAQKAHEKLPDITSLERSPLKRKHKIYIDYLQNRRGQTIAAPYSVRPKPGATVSFPLKWDEVNNDLNMNDYYLKNVPDLVMKRKDPWQDILSEKQDLMVSLNKVKM